MPRGLTPDQIAAMRSGSYSMATLVAVQLPGGAFFHTDAPYNLVEGSRTYQSNSSFSAVDQATERLSIDVAQINITFSGVPPSDYALVLVNNVINSVIEIREAILDGSGNIIDQSIHVFSGRIIEWQAEEGDETASIILTLSNPFADFEKLAGRRLNDGDQQRHFPGDRGMEFAAESTKDIKWGRV